MEALQSTLADVALLSYDPADPDRQIDTLRGLRSRYPDVRLILSVDKYDRDLVLDALRAGARGLFCRADQPFRALCRCITVVHRGEFWISSEQVGYVLEALRVGIRQRAATAVSTEAYPVIMITITSGRSS